MLLNIIKPLEKEQAGLINAFGRVLAEDVQTDYGLPASDVADTDGYAAIASDTRGASESQPRALSVLSESAPQTKSLEPGTVMRVRAGDPLPADSDAVVPSAAAFRPANEPQVLVMVECKPGENVVKAGSQIPAGRTLIARGTAIGPCEMSLIARLGKPGVGVTRKPRVAIITTGASVVDVVDEIASGETRNAARYALVGMLLGSGCELGKLIHVRDGRIGLQRALADCGGCDAMLVALGSGDKHDVGIQALAESGKVYFERVQMEPGAASSFGMIGDVPVFVFPAEAALEVFEALVRPGLFAMMGRRDIERPRVMALLQATLKTDPGSCRYEKALTEFGDVLTTTPLGSRAANIDAFTQPNSLIIIPENVDVARRGDMVEVMLL